MSKYTIRQTYNYRNGKVDGEVYEEEYYDFIAAFEDYKDWCRTSMHEEDYTVELLRNDKVIYKALFTSYDCED